MRHVTEKIMGLESRGRILLSLFYFLLTPPPYISLYLNLITPFSYILVFLIQI